MGDEGGAGVHHQDHVKEKVSSSKASTIEPPTKGLLSSRPTYARSTDTTEMMRAARRASLDRPADLEHYFV